MWSTMSQEQLNKLAMFLFEKALAKEIDYTSMIADFAGRNVNKWRFV